MKVLLTGGTGYIGSSVLDVLVADGHHVTAVVRNERSSLKVSDRGAIGVIGDLFDARWLASELQTHDAAIHTAAGGNDRDPALNDAVISAVISTFSGTKRPFIHTGGIWTYGTNLTIKETATPQPPALTAWRPAGEQRVLTSGVKASVIQPGIVYGHGGGIPAMLTEAVDDEGRLTLIGGGEQHWVTVHVDDLADLYVRALGRAPGGHAYVAASGVNPTVRELGEALSDAVTSELPEDTIARLGAFGEALLLDQAATGERARSELGWSPSRPTLVELLTNGYTLTA